jgi:hypothetical protein
MNVYSSNAGNNLYWLHELVLVVICTFGGGLIAPLLLGKPSMVLNNDLIPFFCVIWWYCVFYLRGNIWLNYPPVKTIWLFFVGLFRTTAVTNIVTTANATLTASAYYPIPVFGPIIAGTALGSVGMFLPFDKGLGAIKNNSPWTMQAAFYTSCFFHFMINDTKGFIGRAMREVLGNLSKETVLLTIAVLQVTHLQLQYYISPECNLFTPVHKVLYLAFPVNGAKIVQKPPINGVPPPAGWDVATKRRTRILIDIARVLFLVTVISLHIYYHVPGVSIKAENHNLTAFHNHQQKTISEQDFQKVFLSHSFPLNETIGSCQFFPSLRHCQPYLARFERVSCPVDMLKEFPGYHPFCTTSSGENEEIYRLAVYNLSIYKYLINNNYANSSYHRQDGLLHQESLLYSIPLVSVNDLHNVDFLQNSNSSSVSALTPSLHFSSDGQVLLLEPFQVPGHGMTILYNHIGTVSKLTGEEEKEVGGEYCGEVHPKIALEGSLNANIPDDEYFTRNEIRSIVLHPKTGKLVARCAENMKKKEEL